MPLREKQFRECAAQQPRASCDENPHPVTVEQGPVPRQSWFLDPRRDRLLVLPRELTEQCQTNRSDEGRSSPGRRRHPVAFPRQAGSASAVFSLWHLGETPVPVWVGRTPDPPRSSSTTPRWPRTCEKTRGGGDGHLPQVGFSLTLQPGLGLSYPLRRHEREGGDPVRPGRPPLPWPQPLGAKVALYVPHLALHNLVEVVGGMNKVPLA